MNGQYKVKSIATGLYMIVGHGFVGGHCEATVFSAVDAVLVTTNSVTFGINDAVVEAAYISYAVNYIRDVDINEDGVVTPNNKNPSRRRFATRDEAVKHGSRFGERKAAKGDPSGTAGHIGFYVMESSDPVNAEINWKTGLTNQI